MLFRGDVIEYDEDTGDINANGHVYFKDFDKNEQIWCSRLEYNTEDKKGKFYDVRGETMPRIVVRPGVLPSNSPFHFEGEWAERIGDKYMLYNGWITNCKLPRPWWRLQGAKIRDRAGRTRHLAPQHFPAAEDADLLCAVLLPFAGEKSSQERLSDAEFRPAVEARLHGGARVLLGDQSRLTTPRIAFRTSPRNAFAHHVDFRGKPRAGTDFDFILYGVQDRGQPQDGGATAADLQRHQHLCRRQLRAGQRLDARAATSTTSARSASASSGRSLTRKLSARRCTRWVRSARTGRLTRSTPLSRGCRTSNRTKSR